MSVFECSPPALSPTQLEGIAATHFNLHGKISALDSERDQNARITTCAGDVYTLKIANAGEQAGLLALQNATMQHIARVDPDLGVPHIVPSRTGNLIESADENGATHAVRLLSFVPGQLFSTVPKSLPLLRSLGDFLGRLSVALQGFAHPAAHRDDFLWNLDNALATRDYIEEIDDSADRDRVRAVFKRYTAQVQPRLPHLRAAVIHGDVNDNNLTVDEDDAQCVTGIFDFGDMLCARQINELAIAMAYALMGVADIAAASRVLIGAYTQRFALQEDELAVLFDLVEMRLAMSVCISSHRAAQFPDNEYLSISQAPALALLRTLCAMNSEVKICITRAAAGLPAVAHSAAIVTHLVEQGQAMGPVFADDLHTRPRMLISFAEGAPGAEYAADARQYSAWLDAELAADGADYAIGLYAENRSCYKGDQFIVAGSSQPRSVHLGIDIFITAHTPLLAPCAGRVYSIQDNAQPYDYGATVILQHAVGDTDRVFYTLYGHLSQKTLSLLREGDEVEMGDVIGFIGESHENGGWAPHLHFQVMTTMLGLKGNFNGAAEPDRMDIWSQICPDPNSILGFPAAAFSLASDQTDALRARRDKWLGPSLSLSYQKKLHITQGRGAWLFDARGRAYLDCVNNICHVGPVHWRRDQGFVCVNNICHVGHCHPHVVEALSAQARTLNTNTRYLHATILDYAERLAATLPDPLSVVYFVNSGSEANELALRLARQATGRQATIVLDWAYHGNTAGLVGLSPYKFARKGGAGAGPHTYVAALPDPFRGQYKGYGDDAARAYADSVAERIDDIQKKTGGGPAAFIAEAISGCGGQVVFPDNYFQHAFAQVRAAGGLCIVDEVQTGFGRVGDAMWAFELQGVVPDIVTLGKPIGNGHPLAAVVTTAEIAQAFNNGMEFFNSFGGNPVSCAVGMAVLDVIEQEKLQENAKSRFHQLIQKLRQLQQKNPLIADIRGRGLFLGIELVDDLVTLQPAGVAASQVVNTLRENGVLLSTDGPFDNVLKFKPPMVFGESELVFFVAQLESAFMQLVHRE